MLGLANLVSSALAALLFVLEEHLLPGGPPDVESLAYFVTSPGVIDSQASVQNNENRVIINTVGEQSFPLFQEHNRTVLKNSFDCCEVEFAENRMEIVQAKVGNVNLRFLISLGGVKSSLPSWLHLVIVELLLNLKETVFYFFFDLRL